MTSHNAPLASVFPRATQEQWRKLVERALKGAPFEKLTSKTYDGVEIAPLYPPAKAPGPRALRESAGRWSILARVDLGDAEAANRLALEDLEGGADGLHLVFAGSQGAYGDGLLSDGDETITHIFEKVRLDYGIPVLIDHSPRAPNAAGAIMRLLDRAHIEPSITRISFGCDPLGAQAQHGFLPAPWAEYAKTFASDVLRAANAGYAHGTVMADARVIHAAGGAEAQELGFALAAALAYLRALSDAGFDIDAARRLLAFRLATDADEFISVAKFRALRRLWARVEEACGLAPAPIYLHAETAWRMVTRRDPWTNLLRATLAAFSAAIGGADAITVLPFTQALGAPDGFARRLARDTQLVLQDEAHIHVVDDAASGAGGFEALTERLCEEGWSAFQQIEAEGGLAKSLETGALQRRVAKTANHRAQNIARARDKITGSNEFPDIGETPVAVLAAFDARRRDTPAPEHVLRSPPLEAKRLAEPFERLRDLSDATLAQNGVRPRIFLANLGPVAAFTARANFAKNFFEAGGIEAVFGRETESLLDFVDAFRKSGAKLACLCSSDRIYCDAAEEVARALHGAGARIYLAGRPSELEPKLRQAGVAEFVFAGCEMLGVLEHAFEEAK
jgi:methylmalonyl-CoA mutase